MDRKYLIVGHFVDNVARFIFRSIGPYGRLCNRRDVIQVLIDLIIVPVQRKIYEVIIDIAAYHFKIL